MSLMLAHQPVPTPNAGAAEPARAWFDAWLDAAYGPDGFWRRHRPAEHFRTAAATGPRLAESVVALADRLAVRAVVDVGAGGGELVSDLARLRPALRVGGIDLRPRPAPVPNGVEWAEDLWDVRRGSWTAGPADDLLAGDGPVLVVAAEWLDDLPCPIAHRAADGWWRAVLVDAGGDERPGPLLAGAEREWADRWWPRGRRAEIGVTRDRAWSALAAVVHRRGGGLVLIDYGHDRDHRPEAGSFAAYRAGRVVPPLPSTELNLTAHVSIDAVRAAGEAAGLRTILDARQNEALAGLPAAEEPEDDPVLDLARRSERAALESANGWGTHRWLVQVA